MAIRTILVEDHAIVRSGLRGLLEREKDIEVVADTGTGEEAVALAARLRPDVVVLDVGLPDASGIDVARRVRAADDRVHVLALSAYTDRQHVVETLRAGAAGYVVKDCAVDELTAAIRTVAGGGRYVTSAVADLVLESLTAGQRHAQSDQLTPREREVLCLLADGKAMKEAARELNISTKTVETHRRAIMEKLQLYSVAELTKHAIREGYSTLN